MIEVTLSLRLINEANDHSHWRGRQKRAKMQHSTVTMVLLGRCTFQCIGYSTHIAQGNACVVTLTRIAPRRLDSDGVVASCKFVRDGVAEALGIDDGDARIEWRYEQRKMTIHDGEDRDFVRMFASGYGVHIRIEAASEVPAKHFECVLPRPGPGEGNCVVTGVDRSQGAGQVMLASQETVSVRPEQQVAAGGSKSLRRKGQV
jgi:hypothetical protein